LLIPFLQTFNASKIGRPFTNKSRYYPAVFYRQTPLVRLGGQAIPTMTLKCITSLTPFITIAFQFPAPVRATIVHYGSSHCIKRDARGCRVITLQGVSYERDSNPRPQYYKYRHLPADIPQHLLHLFFHSYHMSRLTIAGLILIVIGFGMFIFGVSMFSYQGAPLNPIVSKLGMYSFFLWAPIILIGIALLITAFLARKKG
jgi:hypothetical protein